MIEKRSIHITVGEESHVSFKKVCTGKRITMQDYLEECINLLIDGDEKFVKFAEDVYKKKKDRTIKRVTNTDSDAVYRAISGE
jgi:hypothetical protein